MALDPRSDDTFDDPERVGVLSVVMPCYNEAATIDIVVKRVLESPYTGELLIVDDGSDDGSVDLYRGSVDPRVRVVTHPTNRGKGAAVRTGLAEVRCPFVVIHDADLEYDPKDHGSLLRPLLAGDADVVYGSRFVSDQPRRVLYFWHSIGNRFLTLVTNAVTNLNLTDMETCLKAFRSDVLVDLELIEDGFAIEPEITIKVARLNLRIWEVGISYAGRTYAEGKKIQWTDGVKALRAIARHGLLTRR